MPIPCHSHNDYWRRIPLYEAIHYGCTGVEADVWLFDHDPELYVGHDTASLTRNRTFRNMYVNPLVDLLDKQNPSTDFAHSNGSRGVFDENANQTLVLLVDFKTAGPALLPVVQDQIGALRDRGYLTYYNGSTVIQRPITVVATGNAPFDLLVQNTTYRDVFFDAPLASMAGNTATMAVLMEDPAHQPQYVDKGQGTSGVPSQASFDASNSYYASVSFTRSIGHLWRFRLTSTQIGLIRAQIAGAHARGLKARYWDPPAWPVGLRNHVWEVLTREGADMLNVDDLRDAARADWRKGKFRWFE